MRLGEVLGRDPGRRRPLDDCQTWRVNAAGNLLRQSIEAALAEVEQVLDSITLGRPAPWKDAKNLVDRWTRCHAALDARVEELRVCGGPCLQGLNHLQSLRSLIADVYEMDINAASHPDVVLPSVAAVRTTHETLSKLARLLLPGTEIYADRHLTCRAAVALQHAEDCRKSADAMLATAGAAP